MSVTQPSFVKVLVLYKTNALLLYLLLQYYIYYYYCLIINYSKKYTCLPYINIYLKFYNKKYILFLPIFNCFVLRENVLVK